ncbi:hypothetical protein [Streptomyces sp. RPT161]|uniref:hypothetical protein n=1 Tax=Streptomyces sp. RPT161 TaxID=3015993 RepID=UPI0022B85AD1|nr:hypothetical protein [Streptomyces sp. RPT161]
MYASPVLRSLRAAVFAALCVTLAAAGHSLACHQAPAMRADGVGFVAVFALGYLLGGRERSLAGIGSAMGVVQVGLHLLFEAAPMHAGSSMASMPGMSVPGMAMVPQHGEGGGAIAAHAVAALAASWWLRRGEAAVWSLLRQVAALVPGFVAWWRASGVVPEDSSDTRVRQRDARERWTPQVLLRHAVIRRGPPAAGPVPAPSM